MFPRVNLTNTTTWGLAAGSTPAAGMVVYNIKTIAAGFSGTVAYPAIAGDGTGLYYWDGTGWVAGKGMKGDAGVVGVQGLPGTSGTPGTPGSGTPGAPGAGITIVTNDSGTWVYNPTTNTWTNINGPKGDAGEVGATGANGADGKSLTGGAGTPGATGASGASGDTYIDVTNGDVYTYNGTTWNVTGNIKGATGAAGPQGATGANGADGKSATSGAGTPGATGATGASGDTYINTVNGDVYTYDGTTWNVTGNIKGATGANGATGTAGPQGATGANGADGKSVTGGAGTPGATGASGASGDTYIDVTNGDVYTYNGTTWNVTGNIKGATGAAGPQGATGANGADGKSVTGGAGTPGATGATGASGDTYIDVTNGDVYTYDGTTWNVTGNIKGATGAAGPQGATGANGADGKSATSGAGTPGATGATGASGNTYIDVTNGDVYTYDGTTWNVTGNIKGATGATGATGTFNATVDNGLNFSTPTNIQLGGVLTRPITTITTNTTAGSNTLAIAGLQPGVTTGATPDKIVVADPTTGVLKQIDKSIFDADLRLVGSRNHITKDAGVGSNGTNGGTADNIFIGENVGAASTNVSGQSNGNVGIGTNALKENTGINNVAIGLGAASKTKSASLNTAVGAYSMEVNTEGGSNTAIGHWSLSNTTTGNENTAVGTRSGNNITTGSWNTTLGSQAWVPSATADNQLSIGNLIYGTGLEGRFTNISSGNIGIGVKAPSEKLDINGKLRVRTLDAGLATDKIVVADPTTGVLRSVSPSVFTADLRVVGTDNHVTQDAGAGSNGTSLGSGFRNVAIGKNVLSNLSGGNKNIAVGTDLMTNLVNGTENIALGTSSLFDLQNGNQNIVIGTNSGGYMNNASNNIIIGNSIAGKVDGSYIALSNLVNINNSIYATNSLGNGNGRTALGGFYYSSATDNMFKETLSIHTGGISVNEINTAAYAGNAATDRIVVAGTNGVLKTIPAINTSVSNIIKITSAYTASATDVTILANATTAGFTLTIPDATVNTGRILIIRKTDETSNVLTFSSPIKISETTSFTTLNINTTIRIQSDGTDWYKID
ncbi:MAG: hypothetical protein EOP54_08955 [Sphingobacteriales bacterium]|nr:MAG: hypothetical protein EOP54_08955 [Sphingobacteriales bacterium]